MDRNVLKDPRPLYSVHNTAYWILDTGESFESLNISQL